MKEIIRETVRGAESGEENLFLAFEKSNYELRNCDESDFRVQMDEIPAQLIVRGEGTVLDEEGEKVIDSDEVYGKLLLNEVDDGIVVVV
jgi:hypothetical protein